MRTMADAEALGQKAFDTLTYEFVAAVSQHLPDLVVDIFNRAVGADEDDGIGRARENRLGAGPFGFGFRERTLDLRLQAFMGRDVFEPDVECILVLEKRPPDGEAKRNFGV